MGFTVYKCGIVVYAPERIENPDCYIEAVAIGERLFSSNKIALEWWKNEGNFTHNNIE